MLYEKNANTRWLAVSPVLIREIQRLFPRPPLRWLPEHGARAVAKSAATILQTSAEAVARHYAALPTEPGDAPAMARKTRATDTNEDGSK